MTRTLVILVLLFLGTVSHAERILSSDEAAGRFGQVNGHIFGDLNYACQYNLSFTHGTEVIQRKSGALLSFKTGSTRAVLSLEAIVGFDHSFSVINDKGSRKLVIGEVGSEILLLNASRIGNATMTGTFLASGNALITCRKLNTRVVSSSAISIDGVLVEASGWPLDSKK